MAGALLALALLAASVPVGLPISSFARECVDPEVFSKNAERDDDKTIHILGFIPCSRPGGSQFDACYWVDDIPILAMALDQINLEPNLLPGYRLVLDAVKSGCENAAVSTVTLHDSVVKALQGKGPVHHMILGPACTMATTPVAEFSGKYLNIVQVSYTASGMQFQNRTRFPRLYTLQPLVFSYNDAYLYIMQAFGWTRVAVINEVNDLYPDSATDLRAKLEAAQIRVEHYGSFDSDPAEQLKAIKMLDIRIIVALFVPHTSLARQLWCEAVKEGLVSDHHVWFTPVWATLNLRENVNDSCTNEQLRKALSHNFGVLGSDFVLYGDSQTMAPLVSGQWASDFRNQLKCYKEAFSKNYSHMHLNNPVDASINFKEGYVYDSIWAIALALNRTLQKGFDLERFTYEDVALADKMQEEMRNSNFLGISGNVTFTLNGSNETGFRKDPFLEIWQYNDTGELKLRGIYSTSDKAIIHNVSNISWPDGTPPVDGPTPTVIRYPLWSVLTVSITTGIGMLCAFMCLVVTLAYRKHRAFKKSTFRLNVFICIGIFLGFFGDFIIALSVYFFLENITVMEVAVNVANWLYHISFVLAFSSLFVKTWRIYRIFCNAELRKRKYLNDKYLMLAVVAMVTFDVAVLIAWSCVAPWQWRKTKYENPVNAPEKLVIYYASGSVLIGVFLGVLLLSYVLLLLMGMFLAFQIKQNIRSFYERYNESPIVNLSSFLALTLSFGSLIISVIVTPPTKGTIGFLLLLTVLRDGSWMFPMLGLMYLPMMYELVKEKYTGKSIIRRSSTSSLRWTSADFGGGQYNRFSSTSLLSSISLEETPRRRSLTGASPPPLGHSSSSLGEGSGKVTSRPLTTLKEEEGESMPRETSDSVTLTSSDTAELSMPPHHQTESRRRSILKASTSPSVNSQSNEDKRGVHHVQFTAL